MSKLKTNVVVNFVGNSWRGLITLVFVPFYIKFLGIEAYGLVAFFATLQTTFSLLDMGLSITLNREIARLSVGVGKEQEMQNLVRTLEIIYLAIALVIILLVTLFTPLIANYWIKLQHLSGKSVEQAVLMMGLVVACQFPFALYTGGLMGLQKQVLCNSLDIFVATLRGFGAIFVLWLISPSVQAFFVWQLVVAILQTLLSAFFLWRNLPRINTKAKFQKSYLLRIWRFAAGTSGTNMLYVILTQSDKIVLSKVVSLESLGYYYIATLVASSLYLMINPIFAAIFPRFSQLVAQEDKESLIKLYKQCWQTVAAAGLPVLIVVFLFAEKILLIWTGNAIIAENSQLLVRLIIVGTFLNILTFVPYALQLAYGWARMAFNQALMALILTLPLLIWATHHYGAIGAAFTWVLLNCGFVLVWLPVMHRRFFQSEKPFLEYKKLSFNFICVLITGLFGYLWFPDTSSAFILLACLLLICLSTFVVSAWTMPFIRIWIKAIILRFGSIN
jgi:O-antigen/teichoic acid export membrane protein